MTKCQFVLVIKTRSKRVHKIVHRLYPTNQYMQRLKKDLNKICKFCKPYEET